MSASQPEHFRLTKRDPAPTFCLADQDETLVCLQSLRGQKVVVYFYPADDTPGCTTEACDFNLLLSDLSQLGVSVLGISPDTPESHRRFRTKYDLGLNLLSDPALETMKAYGAFGAKMLYGKWTEGIIRSTFLIDESGLIISSHYNVRTKGHAQKMLDLIANVI